jgi:2-dehydro-3-deoxygalactonokinase
MAQIALIGIDWGTSNLRIHRIDNAGGIIESRRSARGILNVPQGGFAQVLIDEAGDWLDDSPAVPVLACGMVGSRQGWLEVPYLPCPVGVPELAGALHTSEIADTCTVHFVAGVAWHGDADQADVADVIRGEETIITGALRESLDDGLVCLPGTHAKWAWVQDGALQRFRTAMSGEVYQVLLEHSILGRMVASDAAFNSDAFLRGVARANTAGGLLHHLFSVRSLRLFDELSEQHAASYLSGLLTGNDVLSMRAVGEFPPSLTLVGEGAACEAYAQAFTALGIRYKTIDGDRSVAAGLHAIAVAAKLI